MPKNIITLRNAGSDIQSMISILSVLHEIFGDNAFNLKDLTEVAASKGLMASNGMIGEEARIRSYNKNMSLDSIPMQFKAYAEIFRLLGWLRSNKDEQRTLYRITYLGKHIAVQSTINKLVELSFLNITLPNGAVIRDCLNEINLMFCYLKAIKKLGNKATKHELIYICHFLKNEKSETEFNARVEYILTSRKDKNHKKNIENKLELLCHEAIPKPIKLNTLMNSTRITISALKNSNFNWTVLNKQTYSLTSNGISLVKDYENYIRPSYKEVSKLNNDTLKALSVVGLIQMFKRSGYETRELEQILKYQLQIATLKQNKFIKDAKQVELIWFSPYQILSPNQLITFFGSTIESVNDYTFNKNSIDVEKYATDNSRDVHNSYLKFNSVTEHAHNEPIDNGFISKVKEVYLSSGNNTKDTVDEINRYYKFANQEVFYPLVAEAFNQLGFDCIVPRQGQNSLRWDGIIIDGDRSIPIEIKSPGEEEFISVKAIKQALENRIIRCSRYSSVDNLHISTYVVGYNLPNKRAEVHDLIKCIWNEFGIRIALFSLDTLTELVIRSLENLEVPEKESFFSLIGNVYLEKGY